VSAPDFITVLGRLLRSGALRDEFATDPQTFARVSGLPDHECEMLARMSWNDLETQALVLLQKRFAAIRPQLVQTCAALGADAWPQFVRYSRSRPADAQNRHVGDALAFSEHLKIQGIAVSAAEYNRLCFVQRKRTLALHVIVITPRNRSRRLALQLVCRWRKSRCREWQFYLAA
jgi:hypothetical protein